jgi:hypothetical protein
MLLSSDMSDIDGGEISDSNSESGQIFGDYEELENFEAYYRHENDFETYVIFN